MRHASSVPLRSEQFFTRGTFLVLANEPIDMGPQAWSRERWWIIRSEKVNFSDRYPLATLETMMRRHIRRLSWLWIVVVLIVMVPLTRRDSCMVVSLMTKAHLWQTTHQFFHHRRPASATVSPSAIYIHHHNFHEGGGKEDDLTISFEDTDRATKKIVLGLTNLVNTLNGKTSQEDGCKTDAVSTDETAAVSSEIATLPPTSTHELLERIQNDYTKRNYLWTGNLDLACFAENCTFADPTLTFTGTDTFQTNTQNLVPLVEAFVKECESKLLSIELIEAREQSSDREELPSCGYIQTRWNMVGSLTASPWVFWKPKIDVIGRTKFWFRPTAAAREQSYTKQLYFYQVYYYDEEWEIPAYQALLQLVSPAGTFSNSNNINNSDGILNNR
jgi:hypothetical protein